MSNHSSKNTNVFIWIDKEIAIFFKCNCHRRCFYNFAPCNFLLYCRKLLLLSMQEI